MDNISKRIVSAALSLAMVAGDTAVAGGFAGSIGVMPAVTASADSDSDEGGFLDPVAPSGSSSSNVVFDNDAGVSDVTEAKKSTDPYETYGDRWKALFTVPEVFINAGLYDSSERGYLADVNDNNKKTISDVPKSTKAMDAVAVNIGHGKKDAVAQLYINNQNKLDLDLSDAEGHAVAEGKVSKTETRLHTESYYDITNWYHYIWKEKKYTYDYIGRTGVRVDEKGDPEYFQSDKVKAVNAGQYLAVTAGDFRGEGKDTIICYNGVYKSPAILEYSCELIDASRMNWVNQAAPKEGDLERWSGREETGSITYEGQVYDPQYKGSVISNVYNEIGLTKVSVGDTDYDKMSRNAPIVDMVAADVDRDGGDELIITAGLGSTTSNTDSVTKMKIYDYYNGGFHETYSVDLKGNYYDGKSWSQTDGAHIQSHEHACNICNVDPDNDGLTVKLKDVKQSWCDPKPIYVLEAAPYFKEFPDNLGSTWFCFSHTLRTP